MKAELPYVDELEGDFVAEYMRQSDTCILSRWSTVWLLVVKVINRHITVPYINMQLPCAPGILLPDVDILRFMPVRGLSIPMIGIFIAVDCIGCVAGNVPIYH